MANTPSKTPFMAFKLAVLVCLFFNFLAWLLLLGGISALEEVCHGGCRAAYGLAWWIIWFQLFLLVVAVVSEALDRMAAFRPTFNILLAINVTLCIIQINNYLDVKDVAGSNSRLNAALAGFIMTAIFSLLIILLSGSRAALHTRYGEDRDVGVATYPQKNRPVSPATSNGAGFVSQPPPQSTYGTTAPAGSVQNV